MPAEMWRWEPRRDGEATADYLARVLDELGARELAGKARELHFDDYLCPPDIDDGMNIQRLIRAVQRYAAFTDDQTRARALTVIAAAKDGEFDGTREEARAWQASPEGYAAINQLFGGRR